MSTEKKTTAEVQAEQTAAAPETMVYCGPTIRGIAPQYTVFTAGLPAKLKEKMEEVPIVKALIFPLDKFAEMRAKVEQDGTRENILYKKAENLLKKED